MIKDVLNEELGISNSVSLLTLRIKNLISSDYGKNRNDMKYRVEYNLVDNKYIYIFKNEIEVIFNNDILNVEYYVLNTDDNNLIKFYNTKTNSYQRKNSIILFLSCKIFNDKINWDYYSEDLQHEVEHYFQLYKKGKSLLSSKRSRSYKKYTDLAKSDNYIDSIIGYTYYYYFKAEENAIINGLYRKIMDLHKNTFNINIKPIEILKESLHYRNISKIKEFYEIINNDENLRILLSERLDDIGKRYKSFILIMDKVINSYIKKFGRLIYKANKDVEKLYRYTLINIQDEIEL